MEQIAYIVTGLCLLILKRMFETRLDKFWHNQDIIYNFRTVVASFSTKNLNKE